MNRYDTISTSAYAPRSLQETLLVPTMRRTQHDAADKNLQTQLSELDKVNPLDKHYAEAQRIKSELSKTIGSQAENLATQGFSNSTTSDIYRTNRTIGDLYSPTGKLGQMNAAKTIFDKEKETYLNDAVNVSKIGRAQALKNWEKHAANNYTGYSEDGKNIASITGLGAPAAQDYEKDRADYSNILGSVTTSLRAKGHSLVPSGLPGGEWMAVDQKGNRVQSDNITALNNAVLGMKNKWVNATGEGRIWADAAGWDPNETNKRIDLDFGTMRKTSDVDNRSTDYNIISGSGTPAPAGGMELITNSEVFQPMELSNNNNSDNVNEFNKLSSLKNPTPDQISRLGSLRTFQKSVDESLSTNSDYKKAISNKNVFYSGFSKNVQTLLKDPILRATTSFQQSANSNLFNAQDENGKVLKGGDGKVLNFTSSQMKAYYSNRMEVRKFESAIDKIAQPVVRMNSIKSTSYQLVPTTPSENTSLNLMNDAFDNALRGTPENMLNYTNIESVDLNGKRTGNLHMDDKQGIQNLFNNSERGGVKIISFVPKGPTGKPEYVVEFNTKEGNAYNMKGLKYGNDDLGNGSPVRVTLSFNKSSGDVLNNINGYIQKYVSTKGSIDPRTGRRSGTDLALDMQLNSKRSEYSNSKWAEVISSKSDLNNVDPVIRHQLAKELVKYGFSKNTTEPQLKNMIDKLLKDKGSNNLTFDE